MIGMYPFHVLLRVQKRGKSVLNNVFFVSEKEIKVYSSGENKWLNNMLLCSKHMEPT
jgi:ribosomal protein S8